jgi:hypothetical protein
VSDDIFVIAINAFKNIFGFLKYASNAVQYLLYAAASLPSINSLVQDTASLKGCQVTSIQTAAGFIEIIQSRNLNILFDLVSSSSSSSSSSQIRIWRLA